MGAAYVGALYAEEQRETIERDKCGARRRDKRAGQKETEIPIILIGSFQLLDLNALPLLGKGELSLKSYIAFILPPSLLPSNCTHVLDT